MTMPLARFFSTASVGRPVSSFRPFALAATAVVLVGALFASFLAGRTASMVQNIMLEKGMALVSALESGMRTGKRSGGGLRLQYLLEELSSRRDVRFIALTMPDGTILAHSDPRRVGEILSAGGRREMSVDAMTSLGIGDTPSWSLMELEGGLTFAVYQRFFLQPQARQENKHMEQGNDDVELPDDGLFWSYKLWGRPSPTAPPSIVEKNHVKPGRDVPYVFVGLDPRALYAAYRHDMQRVMGIGGGLVLVGLCLVLAAYGGMRFRASRRGQRVAEALAEEMALTLPDGLMLLDSKGRISRMNDEALRLTGFAATPFGKKAGEVLPKPLADCVTRLLGEAALADTPIVLRHKVEVAHGATPHGAGETPASGTSPGFATGSISREAQHEQSRVHYLAVRGGHVRDAFEGRLGTIVILRDVSEVRRLEAEVRRKEKMAAVGNLAAGVAHELRNPLSSIKGYATYFAGRFAEGSEDRKAAQVMVREADRLNRAITDLIGLSRPTDIHPQLTDMGALVEDAVRLIRQDAAARKVRVQLEPVAAFTGGKTDGNAPVFSAVVDTDRIRQVILNLCLNALDAMPEGGVLTLRLASQTRKAPGTPARAVPIRSLVLDVIDTGCGIKPEDLPHVFDPYFTTKGHGTGLGLATVHKIMEAHEGRVTVQSEPGRGTAFRLEWLTGQP